VLDMNERILELAKQATVHGNTEHHLDIPSWYLEKFAELIVQECVTIIKHGIDHTEYPHPNDVEKSMVEMKAQMWCRDAIKEYFGVK
jgi:hypothetical protein